MSIVLGAYTFPCGDLHQLPLPEPFDTATQDISFYGVPGSVEVTDAYHGRTIAIGCNFQNFDTFPLLEAALYVVDGKYTVLVDVDLTITIQGYPIVYPNCSFRGFMREGPAFLDGSGQNGWVQVGTLIFRQLLRTP